MRKNTTTIKTEKKELHPNNKHRGRYNFEVLTKAYPELKQYVHTNDYDSETIDFTNAKAVKALNKALLLVYYNIEYWDIPNNYLCPPIPGRADYLHYIADLLEATNTPIHVLDIGAGANCIYPLLGNKLFNWTFVGTETDTNAIGVAHKIINANNLKNAIEYRLQNNKELIFKNIVQPHEQFHVTICNPPFHASAAEAQQGSERKWKNLGYANTQRPVLNFGGQATELWCNGGEIAFISKMITESAAMPTLSKWFTTLVSKSANLPSIYYQLDQLSAKDIKTIELGQGNKVSRIVAWRF
jgi:23S rRNA (adenine1618-N6)-methyltransferase